MQDTIGYCRPAVLYVASQSDRTPKVLDCQPRCIGRGALGDEGWSKWSRVGKSGKSLRSHVQERLAPRVVTEEQAEHIADQDFDNMPSQP